MDEEYLGSFAGIAAALIFFCKKNELPVYIKIAEALETLGDRMHVRAARRGKG